MSILTSPGDRTLKKTLKVLVLEDSAVYQHLIEDCLKSEFVDLHGAQNAQECEAFVREQVPDIVICDILLPGGKNGLEVCRDLKQRYPQIQFLVLSALDSTFDKVQGLEYGAEDYITKPFDPVEFRARFRVLKRRCEQLQTQRSSEILEYRQLRLNPASRTVFVKDNKVALRKREFDLLYYLMRFAGEVVSRERLLSDLWPHQDISERSIDPHIQRLRDKIGDSGKEPAYIETIRGVGYRFLP